MRRTNTVNFVSLTPLPGKEEKAKGRSGPTIVLILAACLIIMAVLVACNSGSTQPTQASAATSAFDGATLLDTRCSVCHSADRARQAQKTHDQWDQTVTRMIGKGAQLTEAEKTVLVDYLAQTYGP
jgi:hypothetical protein